MISAQKQGKKTVGQRSVSLPINDYNRALRSHSATLGEAPTEDGESEKVHKEARRATTDRIFALPRGGVASQGDWHGLSPRPASSHARESQILSDSQSLDMIGMAVTMGSHPNRRSRSLGQLRDAAHLPGVIQRRRSDEIRYWRQSYEPALLSPMLSDKVDPPEVEEPVVEASPPSRRHSPQSFHFEPIHELAGMRITPAANIETRVQELEQRMLHLETMVGQICGAKHDDQLAPRDVLSPAVTPNGAIQSESPPIPLHQLFTRPLSTTTVRQDIPLPLPGQIPVHALHPPPTTLTTPSVPAGRPLTSEHYDFLSRLIREEQTARQHLERVVVDLHRDIQTLRASTYTRFRPVTATSSSEDDMSAVLEDFQTPGEDGGEREMFDGYDDEPRRMQRTLSLSKLTMGGNF